MTKLVKYEVSVKILVTVEDGAFDISAEQWAEKIAKDYSEMALTYRSISADKVIETSVKELKMNNRKRLNQQAWESPKV